MLSLDSRGSRRVLTVASVLSLAYAALSFVILWRGFPHEDAYILFKYARDVGRGAGIVFYPGGPHAEGATDFLWMLALAGGSALHLDPAIGAALLNTVAFFLCARVLAQALQPLDGGASPLVFAVALLILTPCAVAGYLGFGTMVYATLALLVYRAYIRDEALRVPPLGLALGLLRPDGVVLGVAFGLLALPRARELRTRYLASCGACVAAGSTYFAWRWHYFHEPLPLPLYVKAHYAGVPAGVEDTVDWVLSTLLPLAGLGVGARLLLGRASIARRAGLGLVPFAIHAGSFVMTTTSQNVANRFESPAALAVLYFVLAGAAERAQANRPSGARMWTFVALALAAFGPQALIAKDVTQGALRRQYVDVFAWWLGRQGGPELRIASTEAGRMLYWTDAPVLDLVGLSSPETTRMPPSRALLARFDPDVVMLHPAGALDEDRMEAGRSGDVLRLTEPIAAYFRPGVAELAAPDLPPYDDLHLANAVVAPIATLGWLATRSEEYELYAVRFEARFARFHVYAIRTGLPQREAIVAELLATHLPNPEASHLSLTFGLVRAP
jgi:hypothetical protein